MVELSTTLGRGHFGVAASLAPGLILSILIAVAAHALSGVIGAPAVLLALLGGMALSSTLSDGFVAQVVTPGVDISTRVLLRVGVVFLGARITFGDLAELGAPAAVTTIAALGFSLFFGLWLASRLNLERTQGIILACATAICGASAALAIAAALPKSRQSDAAAAIAGVTVIGAVCMLTYPVLAHILGFDARETGIFLGATLHEVAQAIGAGFAVSPETGETAAAIKLLRVACLGPVIVLIAHISAGDASKNPSMPWFVIGFALFALAASLNLLPDVIIAASTALSQWLLLLAIAALGLKTSPAKFSSIGLRPFLVLGGQTLFLGALVAGALLALKALG